MKNNKNLILIIILIILVCCLSGYIAYDKLLKNDKNPANTQEENVNKPEQDKEISEEKDNELSEKKIENLGKELFERTNIYIENNLIFYQEKSIEYNDLSDDDKLLISLNSIEDNKFITNNDSNCVNDENQSSCYRKVSKETFENAYYKIFGNNKTIKYKEFFNPNNVEKCNLENEEIVCYLLEGGGMVEDSSYVYYNVAKLANKNTINIYVKYLEVKTEYEDKGNGLYEDNGYYVTDGKNFKSNDNKITSSQYSDELRNYLSNNYLEKITNNYKLTFKKDTNNNWYWVSTQKI